MLFVSSKPEHQLNDKIFHTLLNQEICVAVLWLKGIKEIRGERWRQVLRNSKIRKPKRERGIGEPEFDVHTARAFLR